jgi:regulator of RNase E activity RraA
MDVKFTIQGGKLIRQIERVAPETVAELVKIPTSILSDCLDRLNAMDSALRPLLLPARSFSGSAFTVEEIEGGNLMSHLALKYVEAGEVLVIDGKGVTNRAGWGGLQTFAAKKKGVRAVIMDGAVRDWEDIQKCEIPVYARAVSPAGPHKGWGGRVNLPVSCGGVVVEPGDVIVGDAGGLVVVPKARAAVTLEQARAGMAKEEAWFQNVEEGVDTADFLGFTGKITEYGIEIV